MKKELFTMAATATLAASGAFADQPTNVVVEYNDAWDNAHGEQQWITVCSNNGRGNGLEVVTTGVRGCQKFVPGDVETWEAPNNVNEGTGLGPACSGQPDCDPKPE